MPIDLYHDARPGQPFALQAAAGGTGRIDGRASGTIVYARVRNPGSYLYDGDVVKFINNGGSTPDVTPSNTLEEPVAGVVVDTTYTGVAHGDRCAVLVNGWHPHIKVTGTATQLQYLRASGTSASASAIDQATTPNIFGQTTGAAGAGYVAGVVLAQPLYVGVHRQLGTMHGLQRHTDWLEGELPQLSTCHGYFYDDGVGAGALTDVDPTSSVLMNGAPKVDWDLGAYAPAMGGFLVRMAEEYDQSCVFTVYGSTDAAFTSPVTVWTSGTISTTHATAEYTGQWDPVAYRYWRIAKSGGGFGTWYTVSLFEDAGLTLLASGGTLADGLGGGSVSRAFAYMGG